LSFKNFFPLIILPLLVSCSHDFNNPLDPLNAGDNKPPNVKFTMFPSPGIVGQDVTFIADQTSDPESPKQELEVRWDFGRDGSWERDWNDWTSNREVTHKFMNTGSFWVVCEVRDPQQAVGRQEQTIVIQDAGSHIPPFAIFTVSPPTGDLNTDFNLNAGNSKNAAGGDTDLEYRWRFDDGQNWTAWDTNPSITVNYSATGLGLGPGLKKIALQVQETTTSEIALATVQLSAKALAVSQSNPTALFTVMPAQGSTSTQFNVNAGVSADQEDDISQLQVQWDFGNGKGWSGWSPNKQNSVTYAVTGIKTITLQVKDTHQDISIATVQVYVK